ncbi:uncharacterized protein LOC134257089 [Saccostrea cucullata]|uniref:uncharacterized protein LOC134257089 n=1 Tax=Saccostrea cuccullata TaxID=36930 RepID=UPI002ED27FF7
MANISTESLMPRDNTTMFLVSSHVTAVIPDKYRYQTDVMADPVILSVLAGFGAIVIIMLLRVLFNKLSGERSGTEGTRMQRLLKSEDYITVFKESVEYHQINTRPSSYLRLQKIKS